MSHYISCDSWQSRRLRCHEGYLSGELKHRLLQEFEKTTHIVLGVDSLKTKTETTWNVGNYRKNGRSKLKQEVPTVILLLAFYFLPRCQLVVIQADFTWTGQEECLFTSLAKESWTLGKKRFTDPEWARNGAREQQKYSTTHQYNNINKKNSH